MPEHETAAALDSLNTAASELPDPTTAAESWLGLIMPSPMAIPIPESLRALPAAAGPGTLLLAGGSVPASTGVTRQRLRCREKPAACRRGT